MTTLSRPDAPTPAEPPRRITLAEFVAMGEGPPYYEFEDGLLIPRNGEDPMVSPASRHQRLMGRLYGPIDQHVSALGLGDVFIELDVYLPDGKLYIPDLLFIAINGSAILDPADDKVHGAPNLVVEITSRNKNRDRVHKRKVYQSNGIQWYWIIDPDTLTLEECHFLPDGTMSSIIIEKAQDFQPLVFPGLTLNLAALMGELPAKDAAVPTVD